MYFASKAALIHEVQSYTYHRYLDRLREAIKNGDGSVAQTTDALRALWDAVQNNKTGTGLNIEVWSAARRDGELKRRASGLQRDARQSPARSGERALEDAAAGLTQESGHVGMPESELDTMYLAGGLADLALEGGDRRGVDDDAAGAVLELDRNGRHDAAVGACGGRRSGGGARRLARKVAGVCYVSPPPRPWRSSPSSSTASRHGTSGGASRP